MVVAWHFVIGQALAIHILRRDRWITKPRPAKPISIIAQVEGSGTELVMKLGFVTVTLVGSSDAQV